MSHFDDGILQAFLDDELPAPDRAAVAEHMLGCEECRSRHDGLKRASALFSRAVAALDVPPPVAEPRVDLTPGRRAAGSFVKAAGLVLLLAAAASAAVPGSPIRAWIESAVEPEPVTVPEAPAPEPAPAPAVPVAVSVAPTDGRVEVVLEELDGVSIRVAETDGGNVAVSAQGTERDPAFSMAPGRIEVRGAVGGEVTIGIPRSVAEVRVLVDGELYAEKSGGRLRTPGGPAGPDAGGP